MILMIIAMVMLIIIRARYDMDGDTKLAMHIYGLITMMVIIIEVMHHC